MVFNQGEYTATLGQNTTYSIRKIIVLCLTEVSCKVLVCTHLENALFLVISLVQAILNKFSSDNMFHVCIYHNIQIYQDKNMSVSDILRLQELLNNSL